MKINRNILIVLLLCVFILPLNSQIGQWSFTTQGFPMYQYESAIPFQTEDAEGNDSCLPQDPYFLLGNYRLSLFTHVSGIFQFVTAERAWARINFNDEQPNYGSNDAYILLEKGKVAEKISLIGLQSMASNPALTKRYFGVGFARYEYKLKNNITCTRIVSVKPSRTINEGTPSFLVSITIQNNGKKKQDVVYGESMPVNYVSMNMQLVEKEQRALQYPVKVSVDERDNNAIAHISVTGNQLLNLPSNNSSLNFSLTLCDHSGKPHDLFV